MTKKKLTDMSRDERSLLLFLESCSVDYTGRVNKARMNAIDEEIAQRWASEGFIEYGRIKVKDHNSQGAHWVKLSHDAWKLAHQERRARATRNKPMFQTTAEN